jgi:zinc protease
MRGATRNRETTMTVQPRFRPALLAAAAVALLAGCRAAPVQPPAQPTAQATFPATPPVPGPAPVLDLPDPMRRTLANGMEVVYVQRPALPVVSALVVVRGAGTAEDPVPLPGLATFTAQMLEEGAAGRTSLELADALEMLGANLTSSAGWDAATVGLYVLRANFPAALQLMADVVGRPDFPEDEVQRLRDQRLTAQARALDVPAQIAGSAFQALVFGAAHPYGRIATTAATRALDRAVVARFHAERYHPRAATLVLVGDVDAARDHALVQAAFAGWRAADGVAPPPAVAALPPAPELAGTRVFLIDRPGSAQSEIRIGHPGVTRGDPDFYALQVMNTLLGGSFTSRLNLNLREQHGFTYGARSGYAMRVGAGPFTAQAAVRTTATDSALVQFFHELQRIRAEPVPADELERAKRFVALGFPLELETNRAVAANVGEMALHGLGDDYLDTYVQSIMAVTAADVLRVARQHVRPDRAVVVVVGDRALVEEPLRALELAPVEVREATEFLR